MEFIFFCLLRRFFVKLDLSPEKAVVKKGLLIRRTSVLPLCAVTMIEVRRTLPLRFIKMKKIILHTLNGKLSFYLPKDENLPFLGNEKQHHIQPQLLSLIFGAFTDTRALSGVVIFSLAILRLGQLPGDYYNKLMSALIITAEEMQKIFQLFDVTIPTFAAFLAVFVSAAWLFALARKLLRLYKFRICFSDRYVTIKHGLLTIYECTLVRNDLVPIIECDTLSTLVTGASPLYCHDRLLYPPTDRHTRERLLRLLFGVAPNAVRAVKPPPRAILGHCAAPLGWLAACSGAAILLWIGEYSGIFSYTALIRSLLWSAAAVSLWFTMTYGIYMLHSFVYIGDDAVITHRSGARLYTVYIPKGRAAYCSIRTNPFQKRGGLCDAVITAAHSRRLKLRNLPLKQIQRIFRLF